MVALGTLTACSGLQGAGMFVGGERISETTIDGYVDDQIESYVDQGATQADIDYGSNREAAVLCVMVSELGRQIGFDEPDTSEAVSELDAECISAGAYMEDFAAESEPRELNDAELAHMSRLGVPFEQMSPQEQANMMVYAGLSDTIADYLEEYDVSVNPRYGVDSLQLLSEEAEGLFSVEIPQR